MKEEYVQIIIKREKSQEVASKNPITLSQEVFGGKIIFAEVLENISDHRDGALEVLNESDET